MQHTTEKGDKVNFTFQDGQVSMPILSITDVAKRGAKATFWDGGGELVLKSGTVIPILQRMGVYFIKLCLDEDANDPPLKQGFQRPG